MSESQIKVTDKRMFTAEGELREEYRFLETEGAATEPPPSPPEEPAPARPEPDTEALPEAEGEAGPGILDLVGMLAEPVPFYLGEAPMPDGAVRQDLRMARMHVDLLDVLRRKTQGNLTAEESSVLEDILHQLKMRFVQRQR